VGTYDLEILDSVTNQLARTIANVELKANGHYDVIVYEVSESTAIRGFVIVYPERPAS
jgi:hypothetical protein